LSAADEPPPEVVPREYWEIWYTACKLLEDNASEALTTLGDFAIHSDIRDDGWHNSLSDRD
jgi:hypothetical protein